ncbi:ABC transporter ATP-binding protein [Streptomyces sp. SCL15-4]|uniref:ABC transporter ATP-binding protein n=1 Tax=Streptomyces sp. SCL15-4 TaxID=2967221 RepID=UPI002965D601|nr:ABC transporter ATP-binding protein [Streptomyces sp. SCL15-4]
MWISLRHQQRSSAIYAAASENRTRLTSQLLNSLQANATVKSFCGEEYERDRVRNLSLAHRASSGETDRYTARYAQTVLSVTAASLLANGLAGGRATMAGRLSPDVFSMLNVLPMQTIFKLTALGSTLDQYQRALGALERVSRLRALPAEPSAQGKPLTARQARGEVRLTNVTFSYSSRLPVVRDLSLQFTPGRTTAIVGATGTGKSTVAKFLTRFHSPQTGRITNGGQDVEHLDLRQLRRSVGYVAQDAYLFDGTIADNWFTLRAATA